MLDQKVILMYNYYKPIDYGNVMKDRLVVFDVDETLIQWEYYLTDTTYYREESIRIDVYPRPFAVELVEQVAEICDVALFTTAKQNYLKAIVSRHFSHIDFAYLYGSEKVTYYKGQKVKDLSLFEASHDSDNILLLDDKPRNARLQPNNYMKIISYSEYVKRNRFDEELHLASKRLNRWIGSERSFREIDMNKWNIRQVK